MTLIPAMVRFVRAMFVGAVVLVSSSTQAQNLFVAEVFGNIGEVTPGGIHSTFATGVNPSGGLAFNSAGNLFVAGWNSGNIDEYTPGGVRSTFASGLAYPRDLAFDSAGNLFEAGEYGGDIYKFAPNGSRS